MHMEYYLKEKNALVGGGSKGIGRATALKLAERGCSVTIMSRSKDALIQTMNELDQSQGQQHDFIVVDYNDRADLKLKVTQLIAKNPFHILINNTGGPPGGPIVDADICAFESAFQQHLLCNHLLSQLLIPGMRKVGYGRIINIISTSVKQPLAGLGVSNTIRGAVANWAKTMANELGPEQITVNNILPGATATGRLKSIIESKSQAQNMSIGEIEDKMKASIPAGRFGLAEEIAEAIAFLASPLASYINGVNLPVDGGRTKSL